MNMFDRTRQDGEKWGDSITTGDIHLLKFESCLKHQRDGLKDCNHSWFYTEQGTWDGLKCFLFIMFMKCVLHFKIYCGDLNTLVLCSAGCLDCSRRVWDLIGYVKPCDFQKFNLSCCRMAYIHGFHKVVVFHCCRCKSEVNIWMQ